MYTIGKVYILSIFDLLFINTFITRFLSGIHILNTLTRYFSWTAMKILGTGYNANEGFQIDASKMASQPITT